MHRLLPALPLLLLAACDAASNTPAERGRRFVDANCARCHATGRSDTSPNPAAPAFRTLHQRYPIERLGEAFAEGILVDHPDMPAFTLEPQQIQDLIAYLKMLEAPGRSAE